MARAKTYGYKVVDVFTTEPLAGNPLAVFPDARELDETTMQKIAKELNLAETAFVLPATRKDGAARVRIFTTSKEMEVQQICVSEPRKGRNGTNLGSTNCGGRSGQIFGTAD